MHNVNGRSLTHAVFSIVLEIQIDRNVKNGGSSQKQTKNRRTDFSLYFMIAGLSGSVGCASDWRPGGRGFDPRRGRQHSFVEIDHEIFSTVILSLPLIQEGQLSVSGERMCTTLVNCLED